MFMPLSLRRFGIPTAPLLMRPMRACKVRATKQKLHVSYGT